MLVPLFLIFLVFLDFPRVVLVGTQWLVITESLVAKALHVGCSQEGTVSKSGSPWVSGVRF